MKCLDNIKRTYINLGLMLLVLYIITGVPAIVLWHCITPTASILSLIETDTIVFIISALIGWVTA